MCSFKNNYKEQRIAARTYYSLENRQKGHSSRNFEVCVPTHAALPNFIMQVLSNQLHFLANRNAGMAITPLYYSGQTIAYRIGEHVALLSGSTVRSPYYDRRY